MSHKVEIKTQFKKLTPLKMAFKELGFEVKENVVARGYGRSDEVHSLVAVNPDKSYGAPDAIIQKLGNEYVVSTSMDSSYVNRLLAPLGGRKMSILKQKFALNSLKIKALENGDEITTEEQNGSIKVKIRTY
jgi:hypothetical protein